MVARLHREVYILTPVSTLHRQLLLGKAEMPTSLLIP